jgi:hypothetical protein
VNVGFTGTQLGMTDAQQSLVRVLLAQWHAFAHDEFHHGDCIGADAEAVEIARSIGYRIITHPPSDSKKRAYVRGDVTLPPAPYLVRNHAIVDAVDRMIGAPAQAQEQLRSGTWATIRYTRKCHKMLTLALPEVR